MDHDELVYEALGNMEGGQGGQGRWYIAKAVGLLLLGTAMAAAFAGPLVDAVQNISSATRKPPFLVSFVVLPMATNSSEPFSSVMCARNKKQRTASLTFSEVHTYVRTSPPLRTQNANNA